MAEQALDPKTRVLLYKLVNGGVLDSVNGVISTGKEAVIMHADGGPGPQESDEPMNVPKECAVKIFKTTLNEFKTRDKYIRVGDDDLKRKSNFMYKCSPRMITDSEIGSVSRIPGRSSTCGLRKRCTTWSRWPRVE